MTRRCAYCGAELVRKRWPSGAMEAPSMFRLRKYCDTVCRTKGQEGKTRGDYKTARRRPPLLWPGEAEALALAAKTHVVLATLTPGPRLRASFFCS